jgi:hypothetical protein
MGISLLLQDPDDPWQRGSVQNVKGRDVLKLLMRNRTERIIDYDVEISRMDSIDSTLHSTIQNLMLHIRQVVIGIPAHYIGLWKHWFKFCVRHYVELIAALLGE